MVVFEGPNSRASLIGDLARVDVFEDGFATFAACDRAGGSGEVAMMQERLVTDCGERANLIPAVDEACDALVTALRGGQ